MKNFAILFFLVSFIGFSQTDFTEKYILNPTVNESSGLIFYNNKLVTLNDSGNTAQLFEMDTISGSILRAITVANATNVDWEDVAQDEAYIYIGDFGNNNGNRTDLKIYRILKTEYDANTSVNADVINFTFEDQTDFTFKPNNNDWDAESLLVYNNKLWIFTKQWVSERTAAYSLPKTPGTHTALNMGSLDIQGLLTGADYNLLTGTVYMTGYSSALQPFVFKLSGFSGDAIFGGTNTKTTFSSTDFGGIAQIEGITAVAANRYLLSSESFSTTNPFPINADAKLFGFNTDDTISNTQNQNPKALKIYPNPVNNKLYILNQDQMIKHLELISISGKILCSHVFINLTNQEIDVSGLLPGLYFLKATYDSGFSVKPFIKN